MKGNNSLIFCHAEMITAMQHYLDTVLFKTQNQARVCGVKLHTHSEYSNLFEIILAEPPKEEARPA